MEMNWLQYLLYGLLSGFAEFTPVSSQAHGILLQRLFGCSEGTAALSFSVELGALLALLLYCRPHLSKLSRERRLAAIPARRRKRQPDTTALLELRLLTVAGVPVVLSCLASAWIVPLGYRLWPLALALTLNGILLYAPQYMPGANKDARSLSGLDGFLIGIAGALSVVPGISGVGAMTSVGQLRGCDRQYSLLLSLLLCVPALAVLVLVSGFTLIATGFSGLSAAALPGILTAGAAAFLTASCALMLMRFLAVKAGFSGFAFYSWGAALFTFILYLLT